MKARTVALALVALGVVALALRLMPADAQQAGKIVRIGWISAGSPTTFGGRLADFRLGMRELGYRDEAVFVEQRWADGNDELLPGLAIDLVRQKPAVILAVGTPASRAVKQATDTIPVVMVAVGDPVGTGLVATLARPGGNLTGISNLARELTGKLLELLHGTDARLSRIAVIMNPANPVHPVYWTEIEVAAERLGLSLVRLEIRHPDGVEPAFATIAREQAQGILVLPDPLFVITRQRIIELAIRHRLPALYPNRDYAEAGGLMSYGPFIPELFRRAAVYVDKILKGAKPSDLPVEQPTKFELLINMRTARAMGLTIPQSLMLRADQVIE